MVPSSFPKLFNFLQIRVTFLPRVTGVYSSTQLKREGVLQLGFIIKGSEFKETVVLRQGESIAR